jgi:hypothetical protein
MIRMGMASGGWAKDKWDGRDYLHKMVEKEIPSSMMLDTLPSVRNQGSVGSCVGFGIGAQVGSVAKSLNIFTEWYSPTWIYNGARFIEGSLLKDAGCEPGDALSWLLKKGCLLEQFWPYNSSKLDTTVPSSAREAQAIKYPGFAYYRVADGAAGICSALASGYTVSIGNPWFDNWMEAPKGVLPEPSDSIVGGHETCLYGYDSVSKVFYGQNSWGTGWGNQGRFTMPFSALPAFKNVGGYDAYYVTFAAGPTPNPPPPKKGCWLFGWLSK